MLACNLLYLRVKYSHYLFLTEDGQEPMTHPYKTREGGATVTIFVPYDCRNHCPFCVNKQEYAHAEGFSVEAILESIAVMNEITPYCDFVFTGGEPFAILVLWFAGTVGDKTFQLTQSR